MQNSINSLSVRIRVLWGSFLDLNLNLSGSLLFVQTTALKKLEGTLLQATISHTIL